MRKEKGQDIIEYALMLAMVVGIGFGIYSYGGQGIVNSISNVFNNAGSLLDSASLPAASSPEDIIKRLEDGRQQGLDILPKRPASDVDIAFDSDEGKELSRKLNIQTPEGDGWYARVNKNGIFVVTYYSAEAKGNDGVTFDQLRENYKSNPDKYGKDSTGHYKTWITINEGIYNQNGTELHHGTTTGHVEGLNGSMTSIYPGTYERPKDQK